MMGRYGLWAEFQNMAGAPFLSSSHTYALMLNLDWFQPYKLTQSSVGALYLTIMNLPYNQRFKRENIILLGIIPGPGEPQSKSVSETFSKRTTGIASWCEDECAWQVTATIS